MRKRGKSKGEEGYGQGRAVIAAGDDVLLDQEAMVETLLSCLNAPDYQPPTLPSVATDLMRLSQQSDVEIDDVVALLEQDSMIAGRILKLVQSPIYSGASPLSSLRDALMRLGLNTLRDIVMEIAMNLKVFRSDDYADTMELLRLHSSATAQLSKLVSKHTSVEGDFAFLAGLLHDVGIAGTLLALSDRKGSRKAPPDLIAIWPAVDRVHEHAAGLMAERWELPPELATAVTNHHQVLIQGKADPLAATLAVADDLAHGAGFGVVPKQDDSVRVMSEIERDCVSSHTEIDRSPETTLAHAREALSLSDAAVEKVSQDFEALMRDR
ncbi:MAG: HDOD domain-containing protein [Myxococcales bacterium]|nr:HDOD domain-containing protein [Myxococcales bacterium]